MKIFWKALLWLSERPRAVRNFIRVPAGFAIVPGLYAALLFLLHKSVEESVVKAIEVQVPTWYWYVLVGVCSAWVSGWLTKVFQETDKGTLKRQAAGLSVTLAHRRVRDERNRHATHIHGRIEPRGALAIDLVAVLHVTNHLRNVTRARVTIADLRGTIIADREVAERFRGDVNRGDAEEITIMTVYRPQDNVTGSTTGERPYKLVGEPEMTPLPQTPGEAAPLIGEAKYRVTIEVLHAGGTELATFIADLSLDLLDPVKLSSLSPLVQTERSPPAGPNDLFVTL